MFSARPLQPLQWSQSLRHGCQWTASRPASTFAALCSRPQSRLQVYQSLSNDPFVNLSLENFLYERSPPDSKVLFLYVNRPCVVIGRNQNPWLETNLRLLKSSTGHEGRRSDGNALFVRRRSGGGSVFHDEGNLNFCVICPKPIFHRDKHAELVVRALKNVGALKTRVNERHDIVLGQDAQEEPSPRVVKAGSTDQDSESPPLEEPVRAVKISGSAYKLSRFRALHHGTCLIDSPNLRQIGLFLRSPARPYIKARGVESVRSPVGNISSALDESVRPFLMQQIIGEIMQEFALLYNLDSNALLKAQRAHANDPELSSGDDWVTGILTDEDARNEPEVCKGIQELHSLEWKYNQCPQFTFSTHPTEEDPRPRPDISPALSPSTRAFFRVKSGLIIESHISTSQDPGTAQYEAACVHKILHNRALHGISDWASVLSSASAVASQEGVYPDAFASNSPDNELSGLAKWLESKLGH
ncbi:lipoyltransferase 1 [Nannizzia gypsea CBS 118893]|uniref:Putative lipoate-protein ligase A n=1 Tax=Arthroderma gypseum (strain ATCC MYA-4604 / CBS 118893) TaxID=535722 RepID=E5R2L9_ARTGP|nr:lipoyltransferase 1 [Nannizzia gypsea CBS 118893]EFQ98677.1 lipoyltransferase 1 [Nannizzia gypsea CBS 118893]